MDPADYISFDIGDTAAPVRRRIHPWRTCLTVELALERGQQFGHGTLDLVVVHHVVEAQLVLRLLRGDFQANIDLAVVLGLATDQAATQLGRVGVDEDQARVGAAVPILPSNNLISLKD